MFGDWGDGATLTGTKKRLRSSFEQSEIFVYVRSVIMRPNKIGMWVQLNYIIHWLIMVPYHVPEVYTTIFRTMYIDKLYLYLVTETDQNETNF